MKRASKQIVINLGLPDFGKFFKRTPKEIRSEAKIVVKETDDYGFVPYILAGFAVVIYLFTSSTSMLWLDAARFISAIYTLGISNPPEPLYILIAHFFTKFIPFGHPVFKVQLLSAILAGIILVLIYKTIIYLFTALQEASNLAAKKNSRLWVLGASYGLLTLAFSYSFWSQAQNVETFVLLTLLVLIILNILIRPIKSEKDLMIKLLIIALICGLGVGTNPILISIGPSILYLMFINRQSLNLPRLLLIGGVGIISVILIYSWIPLRAAQNPFLNWGRSTSFEGLWATSTGAGLNVYVPEIERINGFTGSAKVFFTSLFHYFEILWFKYALIPLPFMGLGGYYIWKRNKKLFILLGLVVATNLLFSCLYLSGNQESWFLIQDIILAIVAGVGFYVFLAFFLEKLLNRVGYGEYTSLLRNWLILLAIVPLWFWWPFLNHRDYHIIDDYIQNTYSPMQEPAIFLGSSDLYDSVSYYVHDIVKPDKKIIPVTDNIFYILRWYRDNLAAAGLSIPDDSKLKYDTPEEYSQYLNDFFAANISKYHIYINTPALRNNFLPRADLGPSLKVDERFKVVPRGLVSEIMLREASASINLADFNFQFQTKDFPKKRPFFLEKVYKGELVGMLNEYGISLQNLADLVYSQGNTEMAIQLYKAAIQFNPKNSEFISRIGNFYGGLNQHTEAIKYFKQALIMDPQNIGIMFNIATGFEHLGNKTEAIKYLEMVLKFARKNSDIAQQAVYKLQFLKTGKMPPEATMSAQLPQGATTQQQTQNLPLPIKGDTQLFLDEEMNLKMAVPNDLKLTKMGKDYVRMTNGLNGSDEITVDLFSQAQSGDQEMVSVKNSLPFKVDGTLSQSQPANLKGFQTLVELYQSQPANTILFMAKKNNQAFVLKIYPENSSHIQELGVILQSLQTLR